MNLGPLHECGSSRQESKDSSKSSKINHASYSPIDMDWYAAKLIDSGYMLNLSPSSSEAAACPSLSGQNLQL